MHADCIYSIPKISLIRCEATETEGLVYIIVESNYLVNHYKSHFTGIDYIFKIFIIESWIRINSKWWRDIGF